MNPFLLTTAYFPPIAYFSCLKKAEVTYIEQYENFGKQSYRNRCEIRLIGNLKRQRGWMYL